MSTPDRKREPEFEEHKNARELQEIEAARHDKMDTFEQARLDMIARLAMADDKSNGYTVDNAERIAKAQKKLEESIKQRQPEFDNSNEEVRNLQQIEAARHGKMDTFEQGRLDMIARLAGNDSLNVKAQAAANVQKRSILGKSGDYMIEAPNNNNNIDNNNNNNNSDYDTPTFGGGSQMYGFNFENEDRDDLPFETTDKRIKRLKHDMEQMHETYMLQLKDMEQKYKNKIKTLQDRIEADKAVLRSKDEMIQNITKENAIKIKYLEKSKLNLIKSASREIDSLRKQIKLYNKGRIAIPGTNK